jgi:hypothetical protein
MARLAAGLPATALPRLDFHQQDSIERFHLLVFEFSSPKLCLARLLQFCYKTVFTEMEIVQFYALLTRRKPGLDSIICSLWDSIQNALNWLLTSGSQVRVLHGSSHKINNLRAVSDGRSTCFCYNSQRPSAPASLRDAGCCRSSWCADWRAIK